MWRHPRRGNCWEGTAELDLSVLCCLYMLSKNVSTGVTCVWHVPLPPWSVGLLCG